MFSVKLLKVGAMVSLFFFTWVLLTADLTYAEFHLVQENGEPDETSTNQAKDGTNTQDDEELVNRTDIILKEGKRKKKLRWWHFVIGIVVAGTAGYLYYRDWRKRHYDTKVLKFEWVKVPAGKFNMGYNDGKPHEGPVHEIELDEFEISKYEVTFEQYDKFCKDEGLAYPKDDNLGRGKRPVFYVSWTEAKAFCDWLSRKTKGKTFALPTEAQWEKAARGTDQLIWPWGNNPPTSSLAHYGKSGGEPVVVGSYPDGHSPYGAHDMAGNVWEWCKDQYDSGYYAVSPPVNPQGPNKGPDSEVSHVIRGGGYSSSEAMIRTTYRDSHMPDYSAKHIGFRICRYK
jgi:formylglycine-generating enzyme required for sulfatase activity